MKDIFFSMKCNFKLGAYFVQRQFLDIIFSVNLLFFGASTFLQKMVIMKLTGKLG